MSSITGESARWVVWHSLRNPTFHPPDESDATGQIFFDSRTIPTPPDQSDRMHPSFNPKVPGSRPGRPTKSHEVPVHSIGITNGYVRCSQLCSQTGRHERTCRSDFVEQH